MISALNDENHIRPMIEAYREGIVIVYVVYKYMYEIRHGIE